MEQGCSCQQISHMNSKSNYYWCGYWHQLPVSRQAHGSIKLGAAVDFCPGREIFCMKNVNVFFKLLKKFI